MVEQRHEFELALPKNDRAPALARRQLSAFARHAGLGGGELASVRLLVSELVTNAVRHGDDHEIDLRVRAGDEVIRIEVADHGSGFERPSEPPAPRNEGGYGLFIVDELCADWGVEHPDGALVWCELERTEAQAASAR